MGAFLHLLSLRNFSRSARLAGCRKEGTGVSGPSRCQRTCCQQLRLRGRGLEFGEGRMCFARVISRPRPEDCCALR
jgi:hypothetical protein